MTPEEFERELNRSAGALRTTLGALMDSYPKAAQEGRLKVWAIAARSVIDLWESSGEGIALKYDREG